MLRGKNFGIAVSRFQESGGKGMYMQQITEQQILALAPNPAAAANGKKISQKGGFVRLEASADGTFYLGECQGSGKSNYITTADYIKPEAPVFRCSCPSRQFPCKHSLALLYEILYGKKFASCEIPEDILKKREKKQARTVRAQEAAPGTGEGAGNGQGETAIREEGSGARKKSSSAGKAVRTRKWKKQLEGLDLAQKLVRELLDAGLGTMGGAALKTYRDLAKQLGDYYLPGPQRLLNRLILEIEAFQKDQEEAHYDNALDVLEKLWTLVKKSRSYLQDQLEGRGEETATPLYEELGGIWKLTELEAAGCSRSNVRLVQLAFWVEYDEARKEYIDTGYWVEPGTGEVTLTLNYRPLKALKYVKQEDSFFGAMEVETMCRYPGDGNCRVRWDHGIAGEATAADLAQIRSLAPKSVAAEAKAAKNLLKNAMEDPILYRLVAYDQIGQGESGLVLRDSQGGTILLGDYPGRESTTERLRTLPDSRLLQGQVLLGGFYYDRDARRLLFWPLSIVTGEGIVRLLY